VTMTAGAAITATVASAAALGAGSASRVDTATGDSQELDRLLKELGLREDADAIRQLHRTFGSALNERRYEDLVRLFADDARVHFNGAVFAGKERTIAHHRVSQQALIGIPFVEPSSAVCHQLRGLPNARLRSVHHIDTDGQLVDHA